MSQFKEIAVGGTVYFWFAANLTTGAAGDGATPLYDVRLAGAASSAAPTASGTPTLLTHANYTDGLHEIAIDTTGYAEGEYAVFCTLTISTVNPAGFCGSFVVRAAAATLRDLVAALQTSVNTIDDLLDTEIGALTTELAKVPKSDSTVTWNATALASVKTQAVAALNTDTYAEPTGAPAATVSLVAKIGRLYQVLRNGVTVTETTKTFNNDAGTALWTKALSDDGTTYTEAEGS